MTERIQFRRAILQSLRRDLDTFDIGGLREAHKVSDDVAIQATRDVFLSQCVKAADDWSITDAELKSLRRLGKLLQLSVSQQDVILAAAKDRVFDAEHQYALSDDMISNVEADALTHLRHTLGLTPMAAEEFGPRLSRPRKREESETKRPHRRQQSQRSTLQNMADDFLMPGAPVGAGFVIAILSFIFFTLSTHCWQCGGNWCVLPHRSLWSTRLRCSQCGWEGNKVNKPMKSRQPSSP